ncbi:porin family protein [Wielerella bovis]|uniref:porin family protein n=1 Tax=Wielerella bovis TaxID=2917790 RepID=UPI00201889B7|nr:porin family protein [Wielerella bovis]ULJ59393.1 porin family protein [Wielerella bovis]ULJ61728.1 porin family protein [Wielerella bovis]
MKYNKLLLAGSMILLAVPAFSKPVEVSIGAERYRETYREYTNGTERFMQQRGNLNSITGAIKYRLNDSHAVKLETRYSKGKIDYTGGMNGDEENPEGTPYGSVIQKNVPRQSYDIRSMYEYTHPIKDDITGIFETGLGYRVLRDLNTRLDPEDYDRKNKTVYAHIGAGLQIQLPKNHFITPKIAYNHGIYGQQISYLEETEKMKQRNAKGLEVEIPVSKQLNNGSKLSIGPFYRGWKVFDSDSIIKEVVADDGSKLKSESLEPKNYTHEIGIKLQYTF